MSFESYKEEKDRLLKETLADKAQEFIDPLVAERDALIAQIEPLVERRNQLSREIIKIQRDANLTTKTTSAKVDLVPVIQEVLKSEDPKVLKPSQIKKIAIEKDLVDAELSNLDQRFAHQLGSLRKSAPSWFGFDPVGNSFEYHYAE